MTEFKDEDIKVFLDIIRKQIHVRLKEKGKHPFASTHEIYGVLCEELNKELLEALHETDISKFRDELMDIIVGAIWGIVSVGYGGAR